MYQLNCPLGHVLEIGPEHFGQRLMCPICQAVVHSSPPRMGEAPGAKYEVQCSQGHILRVKQKYLGKEIRCPSCQELVSMKATMLLNSDGQTLGGAKPELFKKKAKTAENSGAKPTKQKKPAPAASPSKSGPIPSSRIPPPPSNAADDTDDQLPKSPQAEDEEEVIDLPRRPVTTNTPVTIHDEDFEFEIVDTQFNMEVQGLGISKKGPVPPAPSEAIGSTGSIPEPPPPRRHKAVGAAANDPNLPTGLHNLSGSEMLKAQVASLIEDPAALVQFHCPNGHLLEVEARHRGAQIQCPMCNVVFMLPHT